MNSAKVAASLEVRFGAAVGAVQIRSARRLWLSVAPAVLPEMAEWLVGELGCRFATASAIDHPTRIELLYHFALDTADLLITVVVTLDREAPAVPSLTPVFAAANFIEREIHELFGVDFPGHPDLRRLLLPEQWPEKVYPLRRDYVEWDPTAIRDGGRQ